MFFELRVTGLGTNVFCHLAPRDSKHEYRADPMASQESEISLEDDARNGDGEILFAELTGEESAWTVELSKEGLNPGISLDSEANLTFPQRVQNWFEQAQSVAPKGDTQFELEMTSHGTLSVIRQTKKGIQLQLAEFQAVEVSEAERLRFTQKLLLLCTAEIHTLNTHVEVAKTKIEKVKRAHDTISEAMVKSARNERKQRDEMITKFGLVLNEKKDQLRRYQEEALQADKDSDSDDAKSNASRSFNVLSDEESTSSQAQDGPSESKGLPKTKRKERALSPPKKVPSPTRRAVKSQSRSAKESQDLSAAKRSVSPPTARKTKPVPQPPSTKTDVCTTKIKEQKEQKEKPPQQVPPYFSLDKSRRDPTRTVFDYYKKVGLVNDPSQFKEVVSRYASLPKWAALPGAEGNPEEIRAFLRKHEGEEIFQLAHGETYSKLPQKRSRGQAIDPKPLTETKRQRAVNKTTRVQHVGHDAKKPVQHDVEPELKPTVAPKKIAQVIQNNAEDSDSSSEDDFPL